MLVPARPGVAAPGVWLLTRLHLFSMYRCATRCADYSHNEFESSFLVLPPSTVKGEVEVRPLNPTRLALTFWVVILREPSPQQSNKQMRMASATFVFTLQ